MSVCIVTHRRPEQLAALLTAVAAQRQAPAFEVLVGCDRDPRAAAIVEQVMPAARVLDTSGRQPGGGRNALVGESRGDWLLFLDDDVVVGPDLLAGLRRAVARWPAAGVIGGANVTPAGAAASAVVQGAVLAEPLVTGPASRRYAPSTTDRRAGPWSLASCNLAVRRDVWRPFREDLRCAEETDLLAALGRQGVTMVQVPELLVGHHRRAGVVSFARQVHGYGVGRGASLGPAASRALAAGVVALAVSGRRGGWVVATTWAGLAVAGGGHAAIVTGSGRRPAPACIGHAGVVPVAYATGLARGVLRGRL